MNVLFYNGLVLFTDMTVKQGEVSVRDDTIVYAGEKAPDINYDKKLDLKGNLLAPGFCDAHTHSAMTFLRGKAEGMSLDDWLHKQIFPREALLTAEDVYIFTRLAILEYLSSGITSCFDMYYYPEAFVSAVTDSGFRAVLCGAVNDFSESAEKLEEYYLKYNGISPLVSYKLGFHAEYTTSEGLLREIAALAGKYKAPVFSHSSETKKETEECIARHGKTPTEYLEALGLYEYGGGGFHCVYMTENDLEIYRRRGLYAVTNPCSNAKLASGIAPLKCMTGIKLAIGTDGPASNNALDMFREMYLAAVMQKLKYNDAAAFPAEKLLCAAFSGGADAMGINCGRIEEGRLADLIVIDLNAPDMRPLNGIVSNLVYSCSKRNVLLTMVNGRVLYEKGEYHIGDTPEKIISEAEKAAEKLEKRLALH